MGFRDQADRDREHNLRLHHRRVLQLQTARVWQASGAVY